MSPVTQSFTARFGAEIRTLRLPAAHLEVLPGVAWGLCEQVFTPAYWRSQAWMRGLGEAASQRLGETLAEETAACLLGGHGIPAEVGLAAFVALRERGLLRGCPARDALETALSAPLCVGRRTLNYRFARQKASYLHASLQRLQVHPPPQDDDRAFRDWFLECPGVGPKTASWITRNWLGSDRVAIIDVHIQRAGQLMGLYTLAQQPARLYAPMEQTFLLFADRLGVRASALDALIWADMRLAGPLVFQLLSQRGDQRLPPHSAKGLRPSTAVRAPTTHPPVPQASPSLTTC